MGNIIASTCKYCGFSNEFKYGVGTFLTPLLNTSKTLKKDL
jgi:hypothetical protein